MNNKSVYLVLSIEQLEAAARLARQLCGPDAESHQTVSLYADLSGPECDCNGKSQLASHTLVVNGSNLNRFAYLGKL